jgi:hypothetical protein
MVVGLGIFYGGTRLFGIDSLNWSDPVWTMKHIGLVAAGIVLGGISTVFGFGAMMMVEVRSERLNDLFIVLWQFLANGSLAWIVVIGAAMSFTLGKEEAKAAVVAFGPQRAVIHVALTGCVVALLQGFLFFLRLSIRVPFVGYLAFSLFVSLSAARWHFNLYAIEGKAWIYAGSVVPILLLILAPPMIVRDQQQRRLVMEQS